MIASRTYIALIDVPEDPGDDDRVFLELAAEELERLAFRDDSPFLTIEHAALLLGTALRYRRIATELEMLRRERGVSQADVDALRANVTTFTHHLQPLLHEARCVTALADKLETRIQRVLVAAAGAST